MSYEILDVLGDVNPLQYGGWLIGKDPTKVDCLVIEPIDWEENGKHQGEGIDCLVYSVALDKCDDPDSEWFATSDSGESFKAHLTDSGITWDEFKTAISSDNPVKRTYACREIAQYYGMAELDSCPQRITESELKKRYALPIYRARKRGVSVYA